MGFFDKLQDSISQATEQTKAKAQETQLARQKKQKLESLGEQVYTLYADGRLSQQELLPTCEEIADLDRQIKDIQGQAAVTGQQQAEQPTPQATAPPPGAPQAPQAPPPSAPQAPQGEQSTQAAPPPPPPPGTEE